MLVELLVENFAVADRVRVRFGPGFNVLTGETGSGKSLIVDSLALLFGGRAAAEAVRSGAEKARISGIFEVPKSAELRALLDEAGVELEEGELILEREVLANGKSRAFAGAKPVTAGLLRGLAPFLGDLHGQHDQQRLFEPDEQRKLLDEFAGLEERVELARRVYREWQSVESEREELAQREQEILRQRDLWIFQKKEIEAADLRPGEDEALEQELKVLANVLKLREQSAAAAEALEGEGGARDALRTALKSLAELQRIDDSLAATVASLREAEVLVEEAAREVARYGDRLEADPGRLQTVEARLGEIDKLRRKYGHTVAEILAFFDEVRANLSRAEESGERRLELEKAAQKRKQEFATLAAELTEKRCKAARQLEKRIESELKDLNMERSRFVVAREEAAWGPTGADRIEFLISTNLGEEPRPLTKVASGGELSRVALALKVALTTKERKLEARTLVFDEVDAGIGGSAAEQVAKKLKRLAGGNQLICVTHLAQIAAFGEHHFYVEKREAKGRTHSAVEELDSPARVKEVGRMLGGQSLTPEALKYAEQLIAMGA
ncbi:MAG: DNA repair protein RecN [Bryobacter sp.]|nr:DNA repair protein RecN [Bryobacter sp.]